MMQSSAVFDYDTFSNTRRHRAIHIANFRGRRATPQAPCKCNSNLEPLDALSRSPCSTSQTMNLKTLHLTLQASSVTACPIAFSFARLRQAQIPFLISSSIGCRIPFGIPACVHAFLKAVLIVSMMASTSTKRSQYQSQHCVRINLPRPVVLPNACNVLAVALPSISNPQAWSPFRFWSVQG